MCSRQYVLFLARDRAGKKPFSHGHYLTVGPEELEARPYWRLSNEPKLNVSEPDAIEHCEQLVIDESVKLRLESDVHLGVFLNGGIDSSLFVAMMRRHIAGELRTFSIGCTKQGFANPDEFLAEKWSARLCPRVASFRSCG